KQMYKDMAPNVKEYNQSSNAPFVSEKVFHANKNLFVVLSVTGGAFKIANIPPIKLIDNKLKKESRIATKWRWFPSRLAIGSIFSSNIEPILEKFIFFTSN